ncbi:hypothetical protein SKAU_G00305850 [Synaphobranchus kaupii]|uniref:Uncharacterized protein n=1 Tax=Synaphobranchus kaupii TaxID=118154 RepID=A0A9Q1IJU4_SYNKA|nr:hypothetical protein SKAU_G00305850 [Synaphobranchus kaupii]
MQSACDSPARLKSDLSSLVAGQVGGACPRSNTGLVEKSTQPPPNQRHTCDAIFTSLKDQQSNQLQRHSTQPDVATAAKEGGVSRDVRGRGSDWLAPHSGGSGDKNRTHGLAVSQLLWWQALEDPLVSRDAERETKRKTKQVRTEDLLQNRQTCSVRKTSKLR